MMSKEDLLERIKGLDVYNIEQMSFGGIAMLTHSFDESLTRELIMRGVTNKEQRRIFAAVKKTYRNWKKDTDVLWGAMPMYEVYPDWMNLMQLDIECGRLLVTGGSIPNKLEIPNISKVPTALEIALRSHKGKQDVSVVTEESNKERKDESKEVEGLNARIKELEEEIERLNAENEQMQQSETSPNLLDKWRVELMTPLFYNDEKDAKSFYDKVKGLEDVQITDLVRKYVNDRKISPSSKGRKLWSILHAAKLYNSTESNWNEAVKPKEIKARQ